MTLQFTAIDIHGVTHFDVADVERNITVRVAGYKPLDDIITQINEEFAGREQGFKTKVYQIEILKTSRHWWNMFTTVANTRQQAIAAAKRQYSSEIFEVGNIHVA